jgi:predicted TPR repeat methyltransferase
MAADAAGTLRKKFERTQLLHRQGQLDRARAGYLDVLSIQPEHADALHYLGVLTFRQGEEEQAIALIRRSLEINPANDSAWKNLGNIHLEQDRFDLAEQCYRQAAALNPRDSTNFSNLCVALRYQGRSRDAIDAGQRAVELSPDNPLGWYSLGNAFRKAGQLKDAIRSFEQSVTLDPSFAPAYDNYCQSVFSLERQSILGRRSLRKTIAAYRRWLKDAPGSNIAAFMLAALEGTIELHRAPAPFVRDMFDHFAPSYDQRLAAIGFRVPQLIGRALQQVLGQGDGRLRVFDGGCGTGLCGPVLKPYASRLTGVDLSPGMLQKAQRRGLYDTLVESELTAFLQRSPEHFDLTVFSDTLCYFGDLHDVIEATARSLRPGGLTVFSVEKMPVLKRGGGYRLSPHGRYSHSRSYVEDCLESAGLEVLQVLEETIRLEKGAAVTGLIVAARDRRAQSTVDTA